MGLLEALIVLILVLWLVGLGTAYTAGGLIHALLVVVLVLIVIRVLQGRPLS
jgi:hypothetical protein